LLLRQSEKADRGKNFIEGSVNLFAMYSIFRITESPSPTADIEKLNSRKQGKNIRDNFWTNLVPRWTKGR